MAGALESNPSPILPPTPQQLHFPFFSSPGASKEADNQINHGGDAVAKASLWRLEKIMADLKHPETAGRAVTATKKNEKRRRDKYPIACGNNVKKETRMKRGRSNHTTLQREIQLTGEL